MKATKLSNPGMTFHQSDDGTIHIKEIIPGGLFAETDLRPGLIVLSVNDVDCTGKSLIQVTNMVRTTDEGSLTVRAVPVAQTIPLWFTRTQEEIEQHGKIQQACERKCCCTGCLIVVVAFFILLFLFIRNPPL